jgi:hypothetical protein
MWRSQLYRAYSGVARQSNSSNQPPAFCLSSAEGSCPAIMLIKFPMSSPGDRVDRREPFLLFGNLRLEIVTLRREPPAALFWPHCSSPLGSGSWDEQQRRLYLPR